MKKNLFQTLINKISKLSTAINNVFSQSDESNRGEKNFANQDSSNSTTKIEDPRLNQKPFISQINEPTYATLDWRDQEKQNLKGQSSIPESQNPTYLTLDSSNPGKEELIYFTPHFPKADEDIYATVDKNKNQNYTPELPPKQGQDTKENENPVKSQKPPVPPKPKLKGSFASKEEERRQSQNNNQEKGI